MRTSANPERYYCTNENLEAIVLAMQPNENDIILTVGGSGDQSFALLEKAGKVYCVDNSAWQVNYIKQRANGLKRGDYKAFMPKLENEDEVSLRDDYIRHSRIKKIKEKINWLTVKREDVVQAAQNGKFTKIYLSNALGYEQRDQIQATQFSEAMHKLSQALTKGGLIYLSNHENLCREMYRTLPGPASIITTENGVIRITDPKELLPIGLTIDPELTTLARRYEDDGFWEPAVYRRVK